jgi:DNA/RNA-binding domain of Phe-tRNA-synthetase-like protein
MNSDLEPEETCFDVPSMQGPGILALLIEIDPLASLEEDEVHYRDRTEKFCQNLIYRRMTGDVTPEYVNVAVERMFTAAELVDEVRAEDLQNLKYRICQLYFK